MAATIKHLRKVAAKIEVTPGTFLAPDVLLPRTEFTIHQEFNMIEDESIVGLAFKDLPAQGVRIVLGTLAGELDVLASAPILEAVFGSVSGAGPFTYDLPTDKNVKTLSIVGLDGVKTNKYAGCVIPQITFTSEAEGRVMYSADVIGFKAEVRDDTAFPTIVTNPGDKLVHHHAGGASGFIRIADQVDALASGDDRGITSWELIINWQFDNQFDNTLQGSLLQLSGAAGRPETTLGFVVSRHENDDFLGFRDNDTKLLASNIIIIDLGF